MPIGEPLVIAMDDAMGAIKHHDPMRAIDEFPVLFDLCVEIVKGVMQWEP